MAPVNEPLRWPNSSLSSSSAGMAAQFRRMNGLPARLLFWWIASAISSLPVPFSPTMSTFASVGATTLIRRNSCFITSLCATSLGKVGVPSSAACSRRFSWTRATRSPTLSSSAERCPASTGFSRKLNAPLAIARTAVLTLPWPVIMMASTSGWWLRV